MKESTDHTSANKYRGLRYSLNMFMLLVFMAGAVYVKQL